MKALATVAAVLLGPLALSHTLLIALVVLGVEVRVDLPSTFALAWLLASLFVLLALSVWVGATMSSGSVDAIRRDRAAETARRGLEFVDKMREQNRPAGRA